MQNTFHQFIAAETAKGWGSQLQTEIGAVLSYERKLRLPVLGDNSFGLGRELINGIPTDAVF